MSSRLREKALELNLKSPSSLQTRERIFLEGSRPKLEGLVDKIRKE